MCQISFSYFLFKNPDRTSRENNFCNENNITFDDVMNTIQARCGPMPDCVGVDPRQIVWVWTQYWLRLHPAQVGFAPSAGWVWTPNRLGLHPVQVGFGPRTDWVWSKNRLGWTQTRLGLGTSWI